MTVSRNKLSAFLDQTLTPWLVKDFCPNGLQVEGKEKIAKIITGVTATEALIDAAIDADADAILVHHGYFWKGESGVIRGMKRQRLKKLLQHDINLFAYHLPLDIHPDLGNNVQLAKLLGIKVRRGLEAANKQSVALVGKFPEPISGAELKQRIEQTLGRTPLYHHVSDKPIQSVAWCTGGGQSYINLAAEQGIDAFITGEVSEQTIHTSTEMDIAFFAAGHHATERYGVKALGEYIQAELGIESQFVDIDNPA